MLHFEGQLLAVQLRNRNVINEQFKVVQKEEGIRDRPAHRRRIRNIVIKKQLSLRPHQRRSVDQLTLRIIPRLDTRRDKIVRHRLCHCTAFSGSFDVQRLRIERLPNHTLRIH